MKRIFGVSALNKAKVYKKCTLSHDYTIRQVPLGEGSLYNRAIGRIGLVIGSNTFHNRKGLETYCERACRRWTLEERDFQETNGETNRIFGIYEGIMKLYIIRYKGGYIYNRIEPDGVLWEIIRHRALYRNFKGCNINMRMQ